MNFSTATRHDSRAIKPFALALVGKIERGKAFRITVDVETGVHAPHAASLPLGATRLGDDGGIDDADQTTGSARSIVAVALRRNQPRQDHLQPWRRLAYRFSSATFDNDASSIVSAQAAVKRSPIEPRQ